MAGHYDNSSGRYEYMDVYGRPESRLNDVGICHHLYGNCRRAVFLQSLINSCGHDPIFHTVQGNPKYTFEGTCNSVCNIDGRWKDIVEE